ncbi:hypothetical protein QUB60_17820 [Microcoleus sp. A2-C5]|uniref:hypothetical protein n=1 Tax=Microcoleaceae TaxID=1892252 RepID=UPI002238E171|nr:hypothetical protein [Lyngbya sp. CCAP 1446/10]MCW6049535.1 hypothetical protein [Lyngbya sp. CCAP 1446/10]
MTCDRSTLCITGSIATPQIFSRETRSKASCPTSGQFNQNMRLAIDPDEMIASSIPLK